MNGGFEICVSGWWYGEFEICVSGWWWSVYKFVFVSENE